MGLVAIQDFEECFASNLAKIWEGNCPLGPLVPTALRFLPPKYLCMYFMSVSMIPLILKIVKVLLCFFTEKEVFQIYQYFSQNVFCCSGVFNQNVDICLHLQVVLPLLCHRMEVFL